MLSGPHLVLIGIAAMVIAFVVCKAVEAVNSSRQRTDGDDERPS